MVGWTFLSVICRTTDKNVHPTWCKKIVAGCLAAARARMEEVRQSREQVAVDGDELDRLLAALVSESPSRAGAAALRLARVEPVEERRREVAEALEPLLSQGGVAAVAAVEAFRANSRGAGITEADKAIKAIRERQSDGTEGP